MVINYNNASSKVKDVMCFPDLRTMNISEEESISAEIEVLRIYFAAL